MKSLLAALCLAFIAALPAQAHESRPLYIEIVEEQPDIYALRWRTPPSVPVFNAPEVSVSETCKVQGPVRRTMGIGGPVVEARYRCEAGLGGATLEITYPKFNPSVSSLLRLTWADGETRTILAGPKETEITIPAPETTTGIAQQYLSLGVSHILEGYDHLLFLACLLFIAGTGRRIIIAVTGFTLAHSLTLALAALGIVRIPVPPVEAAIALSIVFLAVEIARDRRDTLAWRFPVAVSSSFGLLHGLGFAAVLAEIGLPQTEIVPALLFFNIGVEIGQLMFVGAVILAIVLVPKGLRAAAQGRVERPAAYIIGSLAAFWMAERVYGFLA